MPFLKPFSISGWESTTFHDFWIVIWWPSKHLYKWWPSVICSTVLLHKSELLRTLSKPLPSMFFPSILKPVNTTCYSPSFRTNLSISELDSNCNALECSCGSKVTMLFMPGGSKSFIFSGSWTNYPVCQFGSTAWKVKLLTTS